MSLGSKLQLVHEKVNNKLVRQDASVVFRQQTTTKNAVFGKPYVSNVNTNITLATGIRLSRAKAYETSQNGAIRVNDLKIYIPAHLLTEAQLEATDMILYNSDTYSVIDFEPTEIFSGLPIQWLVYARIKK